MKILLTQIFAKRDPRTPIGILDLAAYGRSFGHEVDVCYASDKPDLCDYDVVGVSSLPYDLELLAELKCIRGSYHGRIVLGGKCTGILHPENLETLDGIGVDVITGQGELLFSDSPIDYSNYPPWDGDDFRKLIKTDCIFDMTEMMTSRGCPYRCAFCNNTEPKVRRFSAARSVHNADIILNQVGHNRVFIVDDVFSLSTNHMREFLAHADTQGVELRGHNSFFVHVDQLKTDQLDAIVEYQPQELQIGIESGDDSILQAMGKTFTAAKAADRLRELHSRGIRTACLFLMGFPGETRENLQSTVDFVEKNRQYMSGWWVSYYQPVPFTIGWELAMERAGRQVDGQWNVDISYVDPNITKQDLLDARQSIMGG